MKSVLITGAYGGMGRSAVKLFREQGFRVFALDKTVGEAEDNIIPIEADITSENSVQKAFATVKEYTDSYMPLFILQEYICSIHWSK